MSGVAKASWCRKCKKSYAHDPEAQFCSVCANALTFPTNTPHSEEKRRKKTASTSKNTKRKSSSSSSTSSSSSSSSSSSNSFQTVVGGDLRWEYAAALEEAAFFPPTGGFLDEKSKWAKLKHATYIVLEKANQVNTIAQVNAIHNVGPVTVQFLKRNFKAPKKRVIPTSTPQGGMLFPTIAEAFLIALYNFANENDSDVFDVDADVDVNADETNKWLTREELSVRARQLYKSPPKSKLNGARVFRVSNDNVSGWKVLHTLQGGIDGEKCILEKT